MVAADLNLDVTGHTLSFINWFPTTWLGIAQFVQYCLSTQLRKLVVLHMLALETVLAPNTAVSSVVLEVFVFPL